jgi:hypothetical protein
MLDAEADLTCPDSSTPLDVTSEAKRGKIPALVAMNYERTLHTKAGDVSA